LGRAWVRMGLGCNDASHDYIIQGCLLEIWGDMKSRLGVCR
jgi:hypothetical protein